MKKEEIHFGDWHRLAFGDVPGNFTLEVLLRTAVLYLALLITLRILGKRMAGQLTISELSVMIMLGAIICVPLQIPERGILQGILVLIATMGLLITLNYFGMKNPAVERAVYGDLRLMIRDGRLLPEILEKTSITREQLFAYLRSQGVFNLGKVKRLYLEGCGLYSLYLESGNPAGLSTLPVKATPSDGLLPHPDHEDWACRNCGHVVHASQVRLPCRFCLSEDWVIAVRENAPTREAKAS
jgi:uncharacterized membrane protein YcaP (DUF421 family)